MILVKEKKIKNRFKKKLNEVYVNTLVPHFQFKNKKGEIVKPVNISINV
ncbi:hypothetical protein SAMN06265371_101395 [Lutibacter agarilyticus]|uniref:Uncharacterized protein n=1 Tax=Lutibacter agarilyticus TaxID=1109740 RepID=A0A238VH02_9FLAO|nr:hypothetical protein [Lutibacter agarilyticus]SNR33458.1 hypothetical protein SAMN06265371_101395 [Lutibacter agarilyticus]